MKEEIFTNIYPNAIITKRKNSRIAVYKDGEKFLVIFKRLLSPNEDITKYTSEENEFTKRGILVNRVRLGRNGFETLLATLHTAHHTIFNEEPENKS